jgi:hypothetical protein
MPLQNRADPFGTLQSYSARGSLMGNRGVLHAQEKTHCPPLVNEVMGNLCAGLWRLPTPSLRAWEILPAVFSR